MYVVLRTRYKDVYKSYNLHLTKTLKRLHRLQPSRLPIVVDPCLMKDWDGLQVESYILEYNSITQSPDRISYIVHARSTIYIHRCNSLHGKRMIFSQGDNPLKTWALVNHFCIQRCNEMKSWSWGLEFRKSRSGRCQNAGMLRFPRRSACGD